MVPRDVYLGIRVRGRSCRLDRRRYSCFCRYSPFNEVPLFYGAVLYIPLMRVIRLLLASLRYFDVSSCRLKNSSWLPDYQFLRIARSLQDE